MQLPRKIKQNELFQTAIGIEFESGIYVDVATGEPLFHQRTSLSLVVAGLVSPNPSAQMLSTYKEDKSYNMTRMEVRSRVGDSPLGHVFTDGPQDKGGLRYINSLSIRFIPKDQMAEKGYAYLLDYVD